jgi:hypothetical protein
MRVVDTESDYKVKWCRAQSCRFESIIRIREGEFKRKPYTRLSLEKDAILLLSLSQTSSLTIKLSVGKRPTPMEALQTCGHQKPCCQPCIYFSSVANTYCFCSTPVPSKGPIDYSTIRPPDLASIVEPVRGTISVHCERVRDRTHAIHMA